MLWTFIIYFSELVFLLKVGLYMDTELYTSIKPYDISIDDFISWNLYDFRIYDIYLNHSEQLMVTEELSKLHGVDV